MLTPRQAGYQSNRARLDAESQRRFDALARVTGVDKLARLLGCSHGMIVQLRNRGMARADSVARVAAKLAGVGGGA